MSRSRPSDLDGDVAFFAGGEGGAPLNVKCVITGNTAVGKTSFLIAYAQNAFPEDYVPTVFDNYNATVLFQNRYFSIGLWDTANGSDYRRLRPLSFPETDCFLLAFAIDDPHSLENVRTKWVPELRERAPDVPYLLVGMKLDLREDPHRIRVLSERHNESPLTATQGLKAAKDIRAFGYFETSAKMLTGVRDVFQEVCRIRLLREAPPLAVRSPLKRLFGGGKTIDPIAAYRKNGISRSRQKLEKDRQEALKFLETYDRTRLRESTRFRKKFVNSGRLSQDILLEILREFVMIDLREDVPAFRTDLYLLRLSQDPDVIRKSWFGVMGTGERRQFLQIFCYFRVPRYFDVKFLPKFQRGLYIENPRTGLSSLLEASSRSFYSRQLHLHRIRVDIGSSEFRRAERCGGTKIMRISLRSYRRWAGLASQLTEKFSDLRALSLVDAREYKSGRAETFDSDLVLPKLQCLVITGVDVVDAVAITSETLQNLTTLRIIGRSPASYRDEPILSLSRDRISALSHLPFLRSILFRRVDLSPSSPLLWLLLSEKETLEEMLVYQCKMSFSTLDRCVPRLRILVIVSEEGAIGGQDRQSNFPAQFLANVESLAKSYSGDEMPSIRRRTKKSWWWTPTSQPVDNSDDRNILDFSVAGGLDYVLKEGGGEFLSNLPEAFRAGFVAEFCERKY